MISMAVSTGCACVRIMQSNFAVRIISILSTPLLEALAPYPTEPLQCLHAAQCNLHLIITQQRDIGDPFGMVLILIDNQNARAHAAILSATTSGSLMWAIVPRPTSLRTSIVPPCCSMICFTVGSPSPVPNRLVLNSGSKILGNTS